MIVPNRWKTKNVPNLNHQSVYIERERKSNRCHFTTKNWEAISRQQSQGCTTSNDVHQDSRQTFYQNCSKNGLSTKSYHELSILGGPWTGSRFWSHSKQTNKQTNQQKRLLGGTPKKKHPRGPFMLSGKSLGNHKFHPPPSPRAGCNSDCSWSAGTRRLRCRHS